MDRLSWRLPLLLTLPPPFNFSKFRASRLATLFTLILLMETCSSDKGFRLVAKPLVAERVEGTEDRHPTIHDSARCHVGLVAVINLWHCSDGLPSPDAAAAASCYWFLNARWFVAFQTLGLLWLMSLVIVLTLHATCSSTFMYKLIHLKYSDKYWYWQRSSQLTLAVVCIGRSRPVTDVFKMKIFWTEVQSCFVRVKQ